MDTESREQVEAAIEDITSLVAINVVDAVAWQLLMDYIQHLERQVAITKGDLQRIAKMWVNGEEGDAQNELDVLIDYLD